MTTVWTQARKLRAVESQSMVIHLRCKSRGPAFQALIYSLNKFGFYIFGFGTSDFDKKELVFEDQIIYRLIS